MKLILSLIALLPLMSWADCSGKDPSYILDLEIKSCRTIDSNILSDKGVSALIKAKVLGEIGFYPNLDLSTKISKLYEIKDSEIAILMSEREIKNCESFGLDLLNKRALKLLVQKMCCDTDNFVCRQANYMGYTMPFEAEHQIKEEYKTSINFDFDGKPNSELYKQQEELLINKFRELKKQKNKTHNKK